MACKGKNCESVDGISHSDECIQEHSEAVNPDRAVIRKAIERYCQEVRDPRVGAYMITNAKDMMEWLLNYDSKKYHEEPPELFPGTRESLNKLGV